MMDVDSRIHAAYPLLPSSSASSKQYGVALMDNELIKRHLGSEGLDINVKAYLKGTTCLFAISNDV